MRFVFLFAILLSSAGWPETGGIIGNGISNGGNSVACSPSKENPYDTIYNVDYLADKITETPYHDEFERVVGSMDDYDKNLKRIRDLTAMNFPSFSDSLNDYINDLLKPSFTEPYSWKQAPNGLVTIDDTHLRAILPGNCIHDGRPFLQTVIRDHVGKQIQYTYDPSIFDRLDPLQKSFLLFHEWLWNMAPDTEVIRNANAIVHSTQWNDNEVDARMAELFAVGLDFKTLGRDVSEMKVSVAADGLWAADSADGRSLMTDGDKPNWFDLNLAYFSFVAVHLKNETTHTAYFVRASDSDVAHRVPEFVMAPNENRTLLYETFERPMSRYCIFLSDDPALVPKACNPAKDRPKFIVLSIYNIP